MTITTSAHGSAAPRSGRRPAALRRLVGVEAKLFARSPAGLIWVIAFPVAGIIALGLIPGTDRPLAYYGGQTPMQAYLPIIVLWSMMLMATSVLPSTLAGYRERGILRRLATTPVSAANLLVAQLIVCAAIELVVVVVVLGIAVVGFGTAVAAQPWGFVLALLLAGAALMAVGMFVAAVSWSTKAAQAIGTVLLFALMFLAGLWLPRASMPELLGQVSDLTPSGAAVHAFTDAATGSFPSAQPLLVLAGYAALFGALAVRSFRWQ
jgi:ABC-2 type transport system permease protein